MKIKNIQAIEVLDSRGNPTVKTWVELDNNVRSYAIVPSGASTGIHEALELRDQDQNRFAGKGVLKAVTHVNYEIKQALINQDPFDQQKIDAILIELDNTPNKSSLGANAILSVSQAVCRTSAAALNKPLYKYIAEIIGPTPDKYLMPCPMMNILNGGKHAVDSCDIQEYMIIPKGAPTFSDALRYGVDVFHNLKTILHEKGLAVSVGDEGGFVPQLSSNEEPFVFMTEAIKKAGYKAGEDIFLGLDSAASEFYLNNKYDLKKENRNISSQELSELYESWLKKYPISSVEDIFEQDDWQAFSNFTSKFGEKIQVVGDDLYCTNIERLKKGVENKATNAIIIKLNQIGTVSETLKTIIYAKESHIKPIISHRSGETEDDFIADLCVGTNAGQIKTGSLCRSERTIKYNRLLEIEHELGEKAVYPSSK